MTQISTHHLATHTTGPQTIMVSKTAKFVKAAMDPGFPNRMLVMHEITKRADHVEWDYKVLSGSEVFPEGYERVDSVVNNAGTVLHLLRKIPVETEGNNFHVDIDAINAAKEAPKVEIGIEGVEVSTENKPLNPYFNYELSTSDHPSIKVLRGEAVLGGLGVLLESFDSVDAFAAYDFLARMHKTGSAHVNVRMGQKTLSFSAETKQYEAERKARNESRQRHLQAMREAGVDGV